MRFLRITLGWQIISSFKKRKANCLTRQNSVTVSTKTVMHRAR